MPALFDPVLGHVSSENLTGTGSKGEESGKRVTLSRDLKSKSHSSLHRSDSSGFNGEVSIPRRKSTIESQRKHSDSSLRRGSVGEPSSPSTAIGQASRSHAALTKNPSGSSDESGAFQQIRPPVHQPNHPSPLNNSQIPPRGAGQTHGTSSHPRQASGPQKKGPPRPKLL